MGECRWIKHIYISRRIERRCQSKISAVHSFPFYFFSLIIGHSSSRAVRLNLRQIKVIYFYLIPIRIYEIAISKIKMILYEHYHRFEIMQNTFFWAHLHSAVSDNTVKGLKRLLGCQCFFAILLLISNKVGSTIGETGELLHTARSPFFVFGKCREWEQNS